MHISELVFVTMFDETICKHIREEDLKKTFKISPCNRMKRFIALHNNFPKELIKD